MFQLRFLGTAGYFNTASRHTLGVLLPRLGILFDAGSGIYRLQQYAASPNLQIFLSHAHLDHICGLPALLGLAPRCGIERTSVHALPATIEAVQKHLFSPALFPAEPPFQWHPLSDGTPVEVAAGGRLQAFSLDHPGGSTGFRIDWPGHSLAYVTDTTASPDADYVERIGGVDLLLHECNFNRAQADWARRTGHSWTDEVGKVAAKARVGRLVVFHVDPLATADPPVNLAEIREFFPRVELAADLATFDF